MTCLKGIPMISVVAGSDKNLYLYWGVLVVPLGPEEISVVL